MLVNMFEHNMKVSETCVYFICNKYNFNEVLFSTMGGYKLLPRTQSENEWQKRLSFSHYDEVLAKVESIGAEKLKGMELTILSMHTEETVKFTTYEDSVLNEMMTKVNCLALMESFEDFMKSHTKWSLSALKMLRSTDCTKYDHTGVQKAFSDFCTLQSTLPEN